MMILLKLSMGLPNRNPKRSDPSEKLERNPSRKDWEAENNV